ncbi:protoporphyrinogen oxidase [Kineococcus sp. R8]|uniref:protoporphyrinogen oxidase n=1 Tax=Kineococcus siccus TaxID=2696567 RepID=UPI001411EEC4|nr:protoporphyrinogen oxidase [Kineococcus siccus]
MPDPAPPPAVVPHVVVVGAGISGLSAAWALTAAGVRVEVLEAAARVGGVLDRVEVGGVVVDTGAESVLARRPEAVDLVRAAGLGADLVHPATARASVRTEGALVPLPAGTLMGVPGSAAAVEGLLPPADVARVAAEPALPAPPVTADVSVGDYVASRVGRAVVDRLVEPLLGGVYAGHADRLSLQATVPALWEHARAGGSLLAGVSAAAARPAAGTPVFAGVRGGVSRLPEALAAGLPGRGGTVRPSTPVTALRRTASGWRLDTPAGAVDADAVVLAVPAPVAARLLRGPVPAAAHELAAVETASMVIAALAVPAAALAGLTGSGLLVPPVVGAAEGLQAKALTLSASKWAWVAEQDPGVRVLRVSLGRARETAVLERDDADVLALAARDASFLLGRPLTPVDGAVARWVDGLPQYAVGHVDRVARVRRAVAAAGALAVCGSVLDGVGVPACVADAGAAAAAVLADLAAPAAG